MTSELRISILIRTVILLTVICISSIYCKIQRDCLFRNSGVSNSRSGTIRNTAVPLSGPNISEIEKLNERMELLKNVKRKMEIKNNQKSKSKKSEKVLDKLIKVDPSIKFPSLSIEDSDVQ